MRLKLCIAAAGLSLAGVCGHAVYAQCLENNYVQDGAPSALRDCQPIKTLKQITPDQMSAADRQLVQDRQAELQQAARFYGFDLAEPGWSYQQALSPLLRNHVLLAYTNATPANRASHFVVVVPSASDEKVQVVPAFSRGLHPYLPGWQAKGSYAVFNRLLRSERGELPISQNSDWIEYAVLYLALAGRAPSVPTETDSIKANWDLSVKQGTTPVISVSKDGSATIVFTDVSDPPRSTIWKLIFDKQGQIVKAERSDRVPVKVRYTQTQLPPPGMH